MNSIIVEENLLRIGGSVAFLALNSIGKTWMLDVDEIEKM